ncbi:MAG: DUF6616 family protein [Planctomycetaceae bacterium]
MYWYMETWRAKQAWLDLDEEGRLAFATSVKALLDTLFSDDLKLLGCVITDEDTQLHGGYQYAAVWQATDRSHIAKIEDGTEKIGWHKYFEQVNHGSELKSAEAVIGHMLQL